MNGLPGRAVASLRRLGSRAWLFYRLTLQSEVPIRSASLAFSTILSIVPVITIFFGIFANFQAFQAMQKQLEETLLGVLLPSTSTVLRDVFKQFTSNSGRLTAIGLVSLLVTTASVFIDLGNMVNRIWEVRARRSLLQNLTIFWLVLTLGPFLLGLSFALSGQVAQLLGQILGGGGWYLARTGKLVGWVSGFALLFLMFTVLPNTQVPKRKAAAAALVTSFALLLLQVFFGFWYGRFTSYNAIYGSLSAVPLFFLWMYLNWYVILMGVQLSRFLSLDHNPLDDHRSSRHAVPELAVLLALGEQARRGRAGLRESELAALIPIHPERLALGLDWLAARAWIAKAGERWVLSALPEAIALRELMTMKISGADKPGSEMGSNLARRLAWIEELTVKAWGSRTLSDLLKRPPH